VKKEDFDLMMKIADKDGRVLLRSKRIAWWREFTFLVNKQPRLGDLVIQSLPTKFK